MADGSAALRSSQGPWRREINLRQFSARSWLPCKGEKGLKEGGRGGKREGGREGWRKSHIRTKVGPR